MFKSYLTIALRNLRKNKGYSFINITGLAMGMAIALLIGLWIADVVGFDAYHKNFHQIAVVYEKSGPADGSTISGTFPVIGVPLGTAIRKDYHDLFTTVAQVSLPANHIVAANGKKFNRLSMWAQHEFPELFTYKMVYGSVSALKDPSTLIIAQSLATALFGTADPTGQAVRVDDSLEMKVGGVFKDLPANTTYHDFQALLPWDNKANVLNTNTDWLDHNGRLYVQLAPGVTTAQASARIAKIITSHIRDWHEESMLYPLDRAHLYSSFSNGKPDGGIITQVRLFAIIGAFVLLLACINFMNLSTARSERRAKEVGIRKTIGSLRSQLVGQFLGESMLVAFLSLVVALALVTLTLPFFNNLAAKQMSIPWTSPLFYIVVLAFTTLTGLLAGSYPAFYLSGFQAVKVLKGSFRAGRAASLPRQVIVVVQFTVSLMLIIGTIIIYRQIQVTKDRPLGYAQERLVTVPINTADLLKNDRALISSLLQSGQVEAVGESSQATTLFADMNLVDWSGKQPNQNAIFFNTIAVNPEFGATVGWKILQGRDFSRSFATDSNAAILNDTAAKAIGFKDPIGQTVTYAGKNYTVIGVVRNMLANSPYKPIEPAVFFGSGTVAYFTVRLQAGVPAHTAMTTVEKIFTQYNPGSPFFYFFNDENFAVKFLAEQRIGNLAAVFAGLAIFISCLGLFGLAAFVAEQRTKEIGVRKILGADVFSLWGLLSKEFLQLVVISLLVAIPASWLAMKQWLQNYAQYSHRPVLVDLRFRRHGHPADHAGNRQLPVAKSRDDQPRPQPPHRISRRTFKNILPSSARVPFYL